jgi:zinc protease
MAFLRSFPRVRFAPAFGLAVALGLAIGIPDQLYAATPTERDGVWAQDYSDLKPEADIRFGQLPNGMRYAIMHNATPVGQVSIRLLVSTGSIGETDAQQGLAHFL